MSWRTRTGDVSPQGGDGAIMAERRRLGTKKQIRPGVWEIGVSQGVRGDGSRRRAWRTVRGTEADADAEIVRLADEMGRCAALGTSMTLDDYFWGTFSPGRHASTTAANAKTYDAHWRAHISPSLGRMRLSDVTNVTIQRWIDRLPPQSAPNYVRTLRAVLSQARFDHLIAESPMEGYRFRLPRRDTSPLPVWGPREVMAALSRPAFRESQLFALWCVMCGCGLSRSEALALDWEDVGWTSALGMDGREHWTACVTIQAACTAEDGMKEPKNSRRYRRVPLAPLFADPLHEVAATGPICQSVRHATVGGVSTGHRLTPSYVPKRWKALFEPGAALDGLPFVQLNRMRATYATLAQWAGLDSRLINQMQGRSAGSNVLESNYLNPYMDTYASAQDAISRKLSQA